MFLEEIRLRGVSARGAAVLTVGIALLAGPHNMLAQRGGRGAARSRTTICVYDCPEIPERISDENDLQNFERLMALQASGDQSAAFLKVMRYSQAASLKVQAFLDALKKGPAATAPADRGAILNQTGSDRSGSNQAGIDQAVLDQAIQQARAGNQNFLASLSSVQEAGLKDLTGKLLKADSEIDLQIKTLDRSLQSAAEDEQVSTSAENLDRALADFQDKQLALAYEIGIILPSSAQELTLRLPPVTTAIDVGGQSVSVTGTGFVSRTASADGHNLFNLKFIADLSDVQQSIFDVLRARLDRSPRCGERMEIREGSLVPDAPASRVFFRLHYERWICPSFQGQESPTELAEGEAAVEIKLTPSVESTASMRLASEITRVDADGALRESLQSGELGKSLCEQVAAGLLSILQKGADLKAAISSTAQDLATIRSSQFQDAGGQRLALILEGPLQLTDAQFKQFSDQLRERLAAQKASSR